MKELDRIVIKVFPSEYKNQESQLKGSLLKPDIEVTFCLNTFSNKYMAYCNFEYKKNKQDKDFTEFRGNSLWSIGSMCRQDLINKIESYNSVEQIIKDFDC